MTHGSGLQNVLDALSQHGSQVRPRGSYYTAQCPAHDDGTASLSLSQGEKGAVLNCFAGCETDAIRTALGLNWPDLFDGDGDRRRTSDELWMPCQGFKGDKAKDNGREACTGRKIAEYRYTDENGVFLFATCRCSRKGNGCEGFAQWHPDATSKSGKRWNLQGVRRVIYRLPEVLKAIREGRRVWFVEGEKDAELLESKGEVATTSPMGAKSWLREYARYFRGASEVIIVADCDEPGLQHAERVHGDVSKFVDHVRVVCTPVDMKGADTSNHFEYGLGLDDFEVVPFEVAEQRPRMVIQVEERHTLKPLEFKGFSAESVQRQLVGSMLKFGMGYDIREADIRDDEQLSITVAAIARIEVRGSLITPETVAVEIEKAGKGTYDKVLPFLLELEKGAYETTDMPNRAAQVLRTRSFRRGIVWSLRAVAEAAMKEHRPVPEILSHLGNLAKQQDEEFAEISYRYGGTTEERPEVDAFDVVEEVAREEGMIPGNVSNVRELRPDAVRDQRQAATRRG